MPQSVDKNPKRRGFILLTHALMVFFTIAMVGLAVDAGTMYVIKGRLSSAVDAAALAAGRSVNLANTVSAASAAATATASSVLQCEFPERLPWHRNDEPDDADLHAGDRRERQSERNSGYRGNRFCSRPYLFHADFRDQECHVVSGTGTATRRGTVMILVLDTFGIDERRKPDCVQPDGDRYSKLHNQLQPLRYDPASSSSVIQPACSTRRARTSGAEHWTGFSPASPATTTRIPVQRRCGWPTSRSRAWVSRWLTTRSFYSLTVLRTGSLRISRFALKSDVRYGKDYTQGVCTSTGTLCARCLWSARRREL